VTFELGAEFISGIVTGMRTMLGVLAAAACASCAPDFDSTRESAPGTFGERVTTLMCKRLAFAADPTDVRGDTYRDACAGGAIDASAPGTLVALVGERPPLVKALDTGIPDSFTSDLQAYLSSNDVLKLYDDDTMSTSIADLADLLDEFSQSTDAMTALSREGNRDGYRPPAAAFGAPAALVSARSSASPATPSVDAVLEKTVPQMVAGGVAHDEWESLVAAISATLSDASIPDDAGTSERTATLAAGLLLAERDDLATEGYTTPLVRRDSRGMAQVALVSGALPAPFYDGDGDGLPDVDALGRYIDANGAPIAVAAPFAIAGDTATRDPNGEVSTYTYFDLGKTPLGALSRDASDLFDPTKGTALDLARGASALLGPRVSSSKTFDNGVQLTYRGYDTTQSPLLDMSFGYLQVLRDPNAKDLLGLVDTLLANHPAATARLMEDAIAVSRLGDSHAEAQILATAPFWDDMMPVVKAILNDPGLTHDLLIALEQPETAELGHRFAEFMTYNDRFDIDPTTQAVTGAFTSMPDRTQHDNGYNRSLWERLLHVIASSNHAQMCNKQDAHVVALGISYPLIGGYDACELVEVDNLATFYLDSIAYAKDANGNIVCENDAGNTVACTASGARKRPAATLVFKDGVVNTLINTLGGDSWLEGQVGITGFRRHPTPEALNRVLFLNPMPAFLQPTLDPAVDVYGQPFLSEHAGTLPVWEKNNFYDEIRPIAQAFVDHHEEQLFIDFMAVTHKHWPSPSSTTTQTMNPAAANYVYGSSGETWEPLIAEAFQTDLIPALSALAPELDAITVNGKPYATVVDNAGKFIVNPLAGLADRQGNSVHTADGTVIAIPSPYDIIAEAYRGKTAAITASGAEGQAWLSSVRNLVDELFRAQDNGTGWAFRNDHVVGVSRAIVAFVNSRLTQHDTVGDRTAWLTTTLPGKIQDETTHPVFAGIADFATAISADPDARAALDSLMHDATSSTAQPAVYAMLRTATADLVQLLVDDADVVPVAHVAGQLTGPGKTHLDTQLVLMQKLRAADTTATLSRLVGQMFTGYDPNDPGVPAIAAIATAIGEVDRMSPGTAVGSSWSASDYGAIFHNVAAFLRENQRGLPRFIAIVKGRNP
jgi:hypothetical protein